MLFTFSCLCNNTFHYVFVYYVKKYFIFVNLSLVPDCIVILYDKKQQLFFSPSQYNRSQLYPSSVIAFLN